MTDRLGEENIHKLLWELSIPAMFGMLSSALFNIVDRYFVGKIDPLALSGVGITMPIQILQMAVVLLIGIGASTLVSIRLGEGKKTEAESILWLSFKYIILSMVLFVIFFVLFQAKLFRWLSVSDEVYPFARPYILIIMIGSIFGMPGFCLNNSLRAIGKAKVTMHAIMYSSILNIILDPIFIFVLDLGVTGAALATVISQVAMSIYITRYFIVTEGLEIHLKVQKANEELQLLKEIFQKGSPTFYVQILATFMSGYMNRSFVKFGSDLDLAALTIITAVFSFYHFLILGIVQGNQPIVGYNWGSGQYDRVCRSLELSIRYAFLISLITFLFIFRKPDFFVAIFTQDEVLTEITSTGMRAYFLALPILGIQIVGSHYFQSVGKPKWSSLLLFLRYGVILIPSIALLAPRIGVKGIYLSNAISDLVASAVAIVAVGWEIRCLKLMSRSDEKMV